MVDNCTSVMMRRLGCSKRAIKELAVIAYLALRRLIAEDRILEGNSFIDVDLDVVAFAVVLPVA